MELKKVNMKILLKSTVVPGNIRKPVHTCDYLTRNVQGGPKSDTLLVLEFPLLLNAYICNFC